MGAYRDHLVEVSKDVLRYIKSLKEMSYEESKLIEKYLKDLDVAQVFEKTIDSNNQQVFIPKTYKYRNMYYSVAIPSLRCRYDRDNCILYKKMKLSDMCDDLLLTSSLEGIIIDPKGINLVVDRDVVMEIYSNMYL